jgi:hypothetical protein
MRNLKKILALVLALVMSMSLVVTANAAFTDEDDITAKYDEAVQVLSGLEVFQGFNDGSFQPQGTINRAQVAAIIYRIVTGDVDDEQVSIYADWNRFPDVKSDAWYAGYVNFCANGNYIKGYPNGNFGPTDNVTGYQALAMILRAIGYDQNDEFTGSNWAVTTASTAKARGITDNISDGTLNQAATRETVAEILFRAITVNKVDYTLAFGYTEGTTSLGYDTFGLATIDGVVTANDWASLTDDTPLAAGKTTIGGKTYNVSTDLTDLGESRTGWAAGKDVLYLVDSGDNTVYENDGAAKTIETASQFSNVTGLTRTDATEQFLNFGGNGSYKSSDIKLAYKINLSLYNTTTNSSLTDADLTANGLVQETDTTTTPGTTIYTGVYRKDIKPNSEITALDSTLMKAIFDYAKNDTNEELGVVFVGTKDDPSSDVSDTISWNKFVADYIDTSASAMTVTGATKGTWLKVIDNDGDGDAEYVLKTVFTITDVVKVAKDGTVTLGVDTLSAADKAAYIVEGNDYTDNDDADIATDDELQVGDVVLYTYIDGKVYTGLADMVTATIDKVNRNTATATTTDGDEYVESAVKGVDCMQSTLYDETVVELQGSTSYDMYLDAFGYLTVFTPTATSGDYTLILDGYYAESKNSNDYAVKAYQDGSVNVVDTTAASSKLFVSNSVSGNSWGNLKSLADNRASLYTTVASLSDDGVLTPVDKVFNRKDVRVITTSDNEAGIPGKTYITGTAYNTTDNATSAYDNADTDSSVEVRGLSSTVYYYVYKSGTSYVVKEYVGYNALPDLGNDAALIEDVYTVGTLVTRYDPAQTASGLSESYYTADVVVVEFSGAYTSNAEQVFIYDTPVVGTNVTIDEVGVIRADGTADTVKIDLSVSTYTSIADRVSNASVSYGAAGNKTLMPGLYYMYTTNTDGVYKVVEMDADDIRSEGIYSVGEIATSYATVGADWAEIQEYTYLDADTLNATKVTGADGRYEATVTDSSKFYGLSYTSTGNTSNATLDDELTAAEVLSEFGDRSSANGNYDSNTVLVAHNSSDEIVYAISFATRNSNYGTNFAQYVWNNVKPAGAAATVPAGVAFYGYSDVTAAADVEATGDQDGDAKNIEISFHDALTAFKADVPAITVTGSDSYTVVDSTGADVTDALVGKVVEPESDAVYNVLVTNGSKVDYWTLTIGTASGDATMKLADGKTNGLVDDTANELIPGNTISVQDLIALFVPTDEDASVKWEGIRTGNTTAEDLEDVDDNIMTDAFSSITATVTAADGTTNVYNLGNVTTLRTVTLTVAGATKTYTVADGDAWTLPAPYTEAELAAATTTAIAAVSTDIDITLYAITIQDGTDWDDAGTTGTVAHGTAIAGTTTVVYVDSKYAVADPSGTPAADSFDVTLTVPAPATGANLTVATSGIATATATGANLTGTVTTTSVAAAAGDNITVTLECSGAIGGDATVTIVIA